MDGAKIWARTYAGPQGGADEGLRVAVDSANNVIVTGTSVGTNTQEDFFTAKYAAADGTPLWGGASAGIRFGGSANQKDVPTGLAVDGADDVIVTGKVIVSGGKANFYTANTRRRTVQSSGAEGASTWERMIVKRRA